MKKTALILSLLFAFTFSSNAQSDATLEETIQWLNTYPKDLISSDYYAILDFEYEIRFSCKLTDENVVEFYWAENGQNNEYAHWQKFVLKDLTSINLYPHEDGFRVILYGLMKETGIYGKNVTEGCDFKFTNADKENAISVFKAFKHLVKLRNANIKLTDLVSLKNKF